MPVKLVSRTYPATPDVVNQVAQGKDYWNEHYKKLSAPDYRRFEQAKKDHVVFKQSRRYPEVDGAFKMHHMWCDASGIPFLHIEKDVLAEKTYELTATPPHGRWFTPDGAETFVRFFWTLETDLRYTFAFDYVKVWGSRKDLVGIVQELFLLLAQHLTDPQQRGMLDDVRKRADTTQDMCEQAWFESQHADIVEQGYLIERTRQDWITRQNYHTWAKHAGQPCIVYDVRSHVLTIQNVKDTEKVARAVGRFLNEHGYSFIKMWSVEFHATLGTRPRGIPEKDRSSALKTIVHIVSAFQRSDVLL